jgi:hypothetical protein
MVDAGCGPLGHEPVSDTVLATWLIGLLCSPNQAERLHHARSYGAMPCVALKVMPETKAAGDAFGAMFPLHTTTLLEMLTRIIAGLADDQFHLISLSCDLPPHHEARISLLLRGGDVQSAELTFGPELPVLRRLKRKIGATHPIKMTQQLDGAVVEALVPFATRDEPIEGPHNV